MGQDKLKRQCNTLKERVENAKMKRQTKEDLATVVLGTSKINYLDPRITVAWCKKHDVPLAKVFNKSLLQKFPWAMDVPGEWRFEYKANPKGADKRPGKVKKEKQKVEDEDDDDTPLVQKASDSSKTKRKKAGDTSEDEDDMPLSKRAKEAAPADEDDSDDDVPLSKRAK